MTPFYSAYGYYIAGFTLQYSHNHTKNDDIRIEEVIDFENHLLNLTITSDTGEVIHERSNQIVDTTNLEPTEVGGGKFYESSNGTSYHVEIDFVNYEWIWN